MAKREFNALTRYFVAPSETQKESLTGAWLELADGILSVDPDISEETEEFAYYDLDGGIEEVVGTVSQAYEIEGHYNGDDPAQQLISKKEWSTGDKRLVWFKIEDTDGATYTGLATVTGVKIRGGDANGYRPFEATIRFKGTPEREPQIL